MKPFVNYVSKDHKVLADVVTVPQEIFDLDNLSEVLSHEVDKIVVTACCLQAQFFLFCLGFMPKPSHIKLSEIGRFGRHIFQKMRETFL
jgi:hypothetical protein